MLLRPGILVVVCNTRERNVWLARDLDQHATTCDLVHFSTSRRTWPGPGRRGRGGALGFQRYERKRYERQERPRAAASFVDKVFWVATSRRLLTLKIKFDAFWPALT